MPLHAFALEAEAGFLCGIKLRNISANRTIGVMRLSDRTLSPLAARFVDVLRDVARDID
jgi:hypothetical protein